MQGPVSASDQRLNSQHCTLCALVCDSRSGLTNQCTRRNRWLQSPASAHFATECIDPHDPLMNLVVDAKTLIWLDACDVQTARAAVALAKQTGATIHVGQSTGSHAVRSVMSSGGWFGTTLSEVAARAQLIVTLGDGILSESPLIAERFFHSPTRRSQPTWLHISAHEAGRPSLSDSSSTPHPRLHYATLHWPRETWFSELSNLALQIQQPDLHPPITAENLSLRPTAMLTKSNASRVSSLDLLAQLRLSSQVVWVWDVDELRFGTDELIVRRLLSVASSLNEAGRCSLLPLDMNVGRVTAEETLLWLTGCPGTASWLGDRWYRSESYSGYSLEQWASAFPTILLISNLASDRSLPNVAATVTLQSRPACHVSQIQVAAVGTECSGHLFRGDRGTVHYLQATEPRTLPSAAELISQLAQRLNAAAESEVKDAH